ncbi:hypothetical protein [Streptomyces sp. NBC_00401]|uniref:hypothetical protein n=1 Tax=Streptomyces sp. NBC_00401 TaxID=2975738 RepID=UPI00225ADD8A|nr:hypothetical protein [Streptomyces sp. NBC_00401]MCX5083802.1 hypothetical protein [Streptomyces sp. NBC_00401]
MRIRTAATAAGGTLALLTVLAPAAQADSHKGDTTFTSVTFSKTTVNIGVSAAQSLTVVATAKDGSGISGIYGGKLVSPDGRIAFPDSASCTRPSSTTMKCTWTYTLDANDTDDYSDLKNSNAGTWHLAPGTWHLAPRRRGRGQRPRLLHARHQQVGQGEALRQADRHPGEP